jgi:hypothetical protein
MKMEAARSYEDERQGPGQRPAQGPFGEGCADWGLSFFSGAVLADDAGGQEGRGGTAGEQWWWDGWRGGEQKNCAGHCGLLEMMKTRCERG